MKDQKKIEKMSELTKRKHAVLESDDGEDMMDEEEERE